MTKTFQNFSNLWVMLCESRRVPAGQPVALTLAGERLVLFRDAEGGIACLIDRCPHRGVALSLGRIDAGEMVCPFHGWRFDGAGKCRHVPWNPDAKRDRLGATAIPVREVAGTIWVYTGSEPPAEPMVPEIFFDTGVRLISQDFLWKAHWTRVMENMLDTPHLPFVHSGSIGRRLARQTHDKMIMRWEETSFGGLITAERPGEEVKSTLRYHYPNMMELVIDPGGRVLRLFAVCNPAGESETRLTLYTARSFARLAILDPLFRRANARIAAEDRAIVESSSPFEVPRPADEKSVATDAPTLAFRKIWFERLRSSGPGEG